MNCKDSFWGCTDYGCCLKLRPLKEKLAKLIPDPQTLSRLRVYGILGIFTVQGVVYLEFSAEGIKGLRV